MLNKLEQKIRKAIPELCSFEQIQLNHVLEYVNSFSYTVESWDYRTVLKLWSLKSNLLSDQPIEVIRFVNEL